MMCRAQCSRPWPRRERQPPCACCRRDRRRSLIWRLKPDRDAVGSQDPPAGGAAHCHRCFCVAVGTRVPVAHCHRVNHQLFRHARHRFVCHHHDALSPPETRRRREHSRHAERRARTSDGGAGAHLHHDRRGGLHDALAADRVGHRRFLARRGDRGRAAARHDSTRDGHRATRRGRADDDDGARPVSGRRHGAGTDTGQACAGVRDQLRARAR